MFSGNHRPSNTNERDRRRYRPRDRERDRINHHLSSLRNRDRSRSRDYPKHNQKKARKVNEPSSVMRALRSQSLISIRATIKPTESEEIKPKFLSRAQREQLALQRLNEKRQKQKKKSLKCRKQRERFFRIVREKRSYTHKYDNNKTEHHSTNNSNNSNNNNRESQELQLIKDQYLGKKKQKKMVVPPSQKFKFNFDWEPCEDTSEDSNHLYTHRANIVLRYGRGLLAGIDRNEQKKKNSKIWKDLMNNREIRIHADDELEYLLKEKREKRYLKERAKKKKDILDSRNWREKKLKDMTERDWRILKEEFCISTKFGGRLKNPIRFWNESELPQSILRAIIEIAKYKEPYKIQRQAIPVGLQNRDCVGIAETGSGKTAAFVIPMLVYILKQPPMTRENFEDGPYAIVLAPTRELAKQIEEETNKFAYFVKIRAITIVGGISAEKQGQLLREGTEIIIATPGRLLDCIEQRILVLNQCKYVVLDEADRMIDMGFEPQVTAIFDKMPASNLRPVDESDVEQNKIYRQTFMFSATMPPAVERLTRKYLRNPVYITIGDPNETAAEHVQQNVLWVPQKTKRKKLVELLPLMESPIMIFVNMKKAADTLAKFLRSQDDIGMSTISLHGGKSQENREFALDSFKNGDYDILVCTNVAGRGIDIHGVQHVINYDMPKDIRDYCHRIGRTGRAGNQGVATSFLCKEDTEIMYDLKKMLLKTGNSCPQELMQHECALHDPKLADAPKTTKQILAKVKPV